MQLALDQSHVGEHHTRDYLQQIGVAEISPATSPFDPGYDPMTVESHLTQSAHLISILKISMACWLIADETATRSKISAARKHNVPTVTGGGPFEIAVSQGELPAYLDLCADIGVTRIECGEGFTDLCMSPGEVIRMAHERGLDVQFELGKKHGGAFSGEVVEQHRVFDTSRLAHQRLDLLPDRDRMAAHRREDLLIRDQTEPDQRPGVHMQADLTRLGRRMVRDEVLTDGQVDRIVALLDPRQPLPRLAPSTPQG